MKLHDAVLVMVAGSAHRALDRRRATHRPDGVREGAAARVPFMLGNVATVEDVFYAASIALFMNPPPTLVAFIAGHDFQSLIYKQSSIDDALMTRANDKDRA